MAKIVETLKKLTKSYKKRVEVKPTNVKAMYRVAQAAKNAAKIAESEKAR